MSRQWTWASCGSIAPVPAATAALISPDGRTVAVRDVEDAITLYDVAGVLPGRVVATISSSPRLLYAPDGSLGTAVAQSTGLELRAVPDFGAPAAIYPFPPNITCGTDSVTFSPDGDYLLSYGGGPSCVWQTVDHRGLAAIFYDSVGQSALRGSLYVRLTVTALGSVVVVTSDFSGNEQSRVLLPVPQFKLSELALSPSGDRVAWSLGGRLWDASTGAEVLALPLPEGAVWVPAAVFTAVGDQVLLGDGVFASVDGSRLATAVPGVQAGSSLALAPDGRHVVTLLGGGVAGWLGVANGADQRVLGPPTRHPDPGPYTRISSLSISTDGLRLVSLSESWWAFGLRVAERFPDSPVLWSASSGGVSMVTKISANGRSLGVAGDSRALYDLDQGAVVSPIPFDDHITCIGTQLRPSAMVHWAAGAGNTGTMDVFVTDSAAGPWQLLAQLPSGCHDAADFSRDEALMATSTPALYHTGNSPGDWKPVWTRPVSGNAAAADMGWSAWGNDVTFSPDEQQLLVSRCNEWDCVARTYNVKDGSVVQELPQLKAPHPSYSPEGHWIIAGGVLLHLPSGDVRPLDPATPTSTAVFAPNGDIFAGSDAGVLTRYCRAP